MKVRGRNKHKHINVSLENKDVIEDKTESEKAKEDQDPKTASTEVMPLGGEPMKQGISPKKEGERNKRVSLL